MSEFYLYLRQAGEGCDYSIGCGETLIPLESLLERELYEEISDKLSYYGMEVPNREKQLECLLVLKKADYEFDWKSFQKANQELRQRENSWREEAEERAQLERLKAKYGEKP